MRISSSDSVSSLSCPQRSCRARAVRSTAIEVADINRGADSCSDFYEFANGKWRSDNPIPAAMPRWSRRWAAGETAKDRLHEILDQASALPDQPKGSVEQLIGDFYGACTDESTINSLGSKPVMPLISEIDQIRDVAAVQRMIGRFHAMGIRVPFQLTGGSDNHKPSDVIAQINAGGLGMPDRDYYVKTDTRFKEAREKYVAHVANVFRLAGDSDASAAADAASVVRMETRFAEASLDNVALARSGRDRSQDVVRRAATPGADLQLDHLLQAGRADARAV